MTLSASVRTYFADPSPTTAAALRAEIMASPGYDPRVDIPQRVAAAREAGQHAEVVAQVRALLPGIFLSATAHAHLAEAYAALGQETEAERERALVRRSLALVFESGDGSQERPWQVLRISDEYDAVAARGRSVAGQELRHVDGRAFDILTLDDGQQTWFELLWDDA